MNRTFTVLGMLSMLAVISVSACAVSPEYSEEAEGFEDDTSESADATPLAAPPAADAPQSGESVASDRSALMDSEQGAGPGGCKADCVDKCEMKGGSTTECSKTCAKACTGSGCNGNNWETCSAGSNSSSPGLCKFMNSVWEKTCQKSGVLNAFCLPYGGCSGCRKQMDKNC